MIAVADENHGVFDVFAITVLSVLVVWATDVFAHTIANQRNRNDDDQVQIDASLKIALRESSGYLYAAILPATFLVLGLFGAYQGDVASWTALWAQVGLLSDVGWFARACASNGSSARRGVRGRAGH